MRITGVGSLQHAAAGQITFLDDSGRYKRLLADTAASAVILKEKDGKDCRLPMLVSDRPYLAFARICSLFSGAPQPVAGIAPSAVVAPSAVLGEDVHVGANVWIAEDVVIGDRCVIAAGCCIAARCTIGEGSRLLANVVLEYEVRIGRRVLIHPGAVIGADGFGLTMDERERWVKIPQCGGVVLGDGVEIGANTTVDRGTIEDTVIEEGVKIDNQVQIAHNVHIGAHTAIAGCVGIAGSTRVGRRCKIGGGSGIGGHIEISDNVTIAGMSMVNKSITRPGYHLPNNPRFIEHNRVRDRIQMNKIDKRLTRLEASVSEQVK